MLAVVEFTDNIFALQQKADGERTDEVGDDRCDDSAEPRHHRSDAEPGTTYHRRIQLRCVQVDECVRVGDCRLAGHRQQHTNEHYTCMTTTHQTPITSSRLWGEDGGAVAMKKLGAKGRRSAVGGPQSILCRQLEKSTWKYHSFAFS